MVFRDPQKDPVLQRVFQFFPSALQCLCIRVKAIEAWNMTMKTVVIRQDFVLARRIAAQM